MDMENIFLFATKMASLRLRSFKKFTDKLDFDILNEQKEIINIQWKLIFLKMIIQSRKVK